MLSLIRQIEDPVFTVPARARRASALALGLALLTADCANEQSPSGTPRTAPPSGTASAPSPSASPIDLVPLPPDTAAGELKLFRLSMERLQQWGKAEAAMNALTAQHPEIMDSMKRAGAPRTLDQMIALIGGEPRFRAIFKSAGIKAHDYVLTLVALQQAQQGYQRVATGHPLPAGLPPALLANITFVQQNLAAIQKVLRPMPK